MASAIAFTCRMFWPVQSTKKSVNDDALRRSMMTTSPAFLSSAAAMPALIALGMRGGDFFARVFAGVPADAAFLRTAVLRTGVLRTGVFVISAQSTIYIHWYKPCF